MQLGGKDDKNQLPLIIGLVVIIAIAVGAFFMMNRGSGGAADTSAPTDMASQQPADGTIPDASVAPTTSGQATPGTETTAAPAGGQTQAAVDVNALAPNKAPTDMWRPDPFAPANYVEKKGGKKSAIHAKLDVPMLGRIFVPKAKTGDDISDKLKPQPAIRVAGILYGQRVNALIQTADGWRTVKPGDKLRDGTIIQRIERDRIVLLTADTKPRYIEVKLAASLTPAAPSAPTSGGTPGGSSGGYGGNSAFDDRAM